MFGFLEEAGALVDELFNNLPGNGVASLKVGARQVFIQPFLDEIAESNVAPVMIGVVACVDLAKREPKQVRHEGEASGTAKKRPSLHLPRPKRTSRRQGEWIIPAFS